jgi:hypothetical protein
MSKFVQFLGNAHINGLNLALYDNGSVRLERVGTDACHVIRKFSSAEAAKSWFGSFPGKNLQKMLAAIDELRGVK